MLIHVDGAESLKQLFLVSFTLVPFYNVKLGAPAPLAKQARIHVVENQLAEFTWRQCFVSQTFPVDLQLLPVWVLSKRG